MLHGLKLAMANPRGDKEGCQQMFSGYKCSKTMTGVYKLTVSFPRDIRPSFNQQLHATESRAVASHQCMHLAEGQKAEGR